MDTLILANAMLFLSTLSLRRATARRESRQQPAGISIHALLAESDLGRVNSMLTLIQFLSTLSLRRATGLYLVTEKDIPISIHALLAESDGTSSR